MKPALLLVAGLALVAEPAAPPAASGVNEHFIEADRLWRSGSFLRAQRILEALEADSRADVDARLAARALRDLGRTLDSLAQPDEARERWERALEIARSLGDGALVASVLLEQGFAAWRRADYETAESLAHAALRLQESSGDGAGRARTVMLLGKVALKRGAYRDAVRLEEEALAIEETEGDLQAQADVHEALGNVFHDLRSFAAAERAFGRRLELVRRIGDPAQEAHALNYLGFVHQLDGDLDAALAIQEEALRVARASGDDGALSHALHSIGSIHRDLGRLSEARNDYLEAIRLRERAGDPRSRAWSLAGLGRIEKESSRPRAALAAYREAVSVFERTRDRRALAWHRLEVARLHAILGERRPAREAYEATLAEMDAIELPYTCLALSEYGLLLAEDGEAERATRAGHDARERADASGNPEMRWTAAHGNGRILVRLGRREEALASILDALAIIEGMRPELLPSDAAKSGFFEQRQKVYEDAATLLVDLGRPERALEIAERARARAFLDLLGSTGGEGFAPEDAPGDAATPSDAPPEPVASRVAASLERGAPGATVPANESGKTPPLASTASLEPPGFEAIREEARRRSAPIVEYFTTADRLFVWLVAADGELHAMSQPVGRAGLLRDAEAARLESGGDGARRRLHRRLIEPLEKYLQADPARAVLVVPHGPLFLVSLGGLLDARGRYVVERHALAYSPSIGVLRFLRTRASRAPGDARGVLVVGNPRMPKPRRGDPPLPPLPGADAEAEAVRRAWPEGEATVLRGDAARETAVRRLAPRSAVIHLATHGVVPANDSLRSYLALTPDATRDPQGDGFLTAREVFDLRISADLVVLSACDTGLGHISSDGVMGLGRAFLNAGATAVVATLWRVADPVARREMELLHAELRRGTPKAEALRRAQVGTIGELRAGTIKTSGGASIPPGPAYWAAFVVVGDPD